MNILRNVCLLADKGTTTDNAQKAFMYVAETKTWKELDFLLIPDDETSVNRLERIEKHVEGRSMFFWIAPEFKRMGHPFEIFVAKLEEDSTPEMVGKAASRHNFAPRENLFFIDNDGEKYLIAVNILRSILKDIAESVDIHGYEFTDVKNNQYF